MSAGALLLLRGFGTRFRAHDVRRIAAGLRAAADALPVPAVFAGAAPALRAPEIHPLPVAVKGKLAHAR